MAGWWVSGEILVLGRSGVRRLGSTYEKGFWPPASVTSTCCEDGPCVQKVPKIGWESSRAVLSPTTWNSPELLRGWIASDDSWTTDFDMIG
jgi:hypothetical protein